MECDSGGQPAKHAGTDGAVRVVVISDTHTSHRQLVLPDGDILIHCGDFTFYGPFCARDPKLALALTSLPLIGRGSR